MATKTYCDGCDDEIRFVDPENRVTIIIGDDSTIYDLCDDCTSRHMHPRKWERMAKPALR